MINHQINKNLNIPIKLFFNRVKRVRNYKNFVPWCIDSWETKGEFHTMEYDEFMKKFPSLHENILAREKIKEISSKDNLIRLKQFDGGIKVGFNILDFSYTSNIVCIEPNIVLSITEGSNSKIFKTLESVWIMNQNKEKNSSMCVNYFINFEFKSFMFSHVTNLFLSFLGENIMKAFIQKCEKELNENKIESDVKCENLDFVEILDHRMKIIYFDSVSEKHKIRSLFINLHKVNKLSVHELHDSLKILEGNQCYVKKLAFLSEIAIWSNDVQIEKIKNEIMSF